jgi:hypothetical protein
MFAQAFLWFAIIAVFTRIRMIAGSVAYVIVLSTIVISDLKYTRISLQDVVGGGNLISGASRSHLLTRVLDNQVQNNCDVNYDTANPPLIKVLGATRGCAKSFIARPKLFGSTAAGALAMVETNPLHQILGITKFTARATSELSPKTVRLSFPYGPLNDVPVVTTRSVVEYSTIVRDPDDDSIFNEVKAISGNSDSAVNQLVFANSSLGSHYYLPDFGITAVFQTERDYFFPEGKFAGVGRYLLFRIQSPAKAPRLVLDLTSSVVGDGSASLPPATVIGENAVPVGLLGYGAARVISPPLTPKVVDGVAYILLDLGADPKVHDIPRSGLMKLYGTKVAIDYRRLVTYARQIRLVDGDDAVEPASPSKVNKFPSDLGNKNLEFSGIYEDGWLGDKGFLVLYSDKPGKVEFRGLFPQGLGLDSVDLTLTVEGGTAIRKRLEPGPFELEFPVGSGRSRIGFQFSAVSRLPGGDNRPAVALLSSVSIQPGDAKSPEQPKSVNLPNVIAGVGVGADGVFLDGWLGQQSFVVVNPSQAGKVVLHGMVPGGIGLDDQEIQIANEAGDTVRKKLEPGPFEVEVPVKAGRSKILIDFSQSANLPKGDGRNVAALLQSMAVTPASE